MVKRFLATVLGTAVVLVVTLLIRQALHATYPVSTSAALPAAPTGTAFILIDEATVTPTCPAEVQQLPQGPEFDRCLQARLYHDATARALELQTMEAIPTGTRPPGGGEAVFGPWIPGAETRAVVELSLQNKMGAPHYWQDATSIWHNGVIPRAGWDWEELDVLAKPGPNNHPRVWGVTIGGSVPEKYVPQWVAPLPIGTIKITNITGPGGILSFTASGGQTGTLHLLTGVWTIDGVERPSLVPTPAPTAPLPTWAVTPTVDPVRVAREAQEAATRDVAEVSLDTLLDAPPDWQDATSIWHNGALPSASGTWEPLYVLAKPGLKDHARVWGVSRNGGVAPEYVPQWVAPLPVGTLTITNATGPWGVISFTASGGQTGTLDLATGVWTIDGAVLPSLVPTPTPTGQP